MAWGFGTWTAQGVDNNTGLVKINSLGALSFDVNYQGTQYYSVPAGYSLAFLHQGGGSQYGRMRITASGNAISISTVNSNDYSAGTYPRFQNNQLVVYVR